MVDNACFCCGKYIFDVQNIQESRCITVEEYVETVLRPILKINKSVAAIIKRFGLNNKFVLNKSECELCGAPHAVWYNLDVDSTKVKQVHYFYSGAYEPCEKDKAFISEFRSRFLSR